MGTAKNRKWERAKNKTNKQTNKQRIETKRNEKRAGIVLFVRAFALLLTLSFKIEYEYAFRISEPSLFPVVDQ